VVVLSLAGGTISLIVGAAMLRLSFTHTYERYIRVGMGPLLTLAGVALILLGLLTLWRALRQANEPPAHDHDNHDHDRVGVGWLLLAPIAALLLVAPPTLGSYGVDRASAVDISTGAPVFGAIRPRAEPLPMSLLEFAQRAFDHNGASFNRAEVELTGFVAGVEADGFRLARYQIACCAADATAVVVRVVGAPRPLPTRDEWVTVNGRFKNGSQETPELAATRVVHIATPEDPYE
jgi:uncharacterized repeat protein (TIGR03943 family)